MQLKSSSVSKYKIYLFMFEFKRNDVYLVQKKLLNFEVFNCALNVKKMFLQPYICASFLSQVN